MTTLNISWFRSSTNSKHLSWSKRTIRLAINTEMCNHFIAEPEFPTSNRIRRDNFWVMTRNTPHRGEYVLTCDDLAGQEINEFPHDSAAVALPKQLVEGHNLFLVMRP